MEMFEEAIMSKYRFPSLVGDINIEDLSDLPLTSQRGISLNNVAKKLNKALKESEEESFVVKKNKTNEILEKKLLIVKHIIAVKLKEIELKENAVQRKNKKEELRAIIIAKEHDDLKNNTSIEDLKKMEQDL